MRDGNDNAAARFGLTQRPRFPPFHGILVEIAAAGTGMSGKTMAFTVFALCLAPAALAAGTVPATPSAVAALDALFARHVSASTPGCAIGVRQGRMELQRSYGQADLEHGVANSVDSIFNVGSVAKQFTAAATLLLADEGKLRLDDDIREYLPELPDFGTPITIDELLGHTSGLRDFRATDGWTGRDALPQNNADILAYAARQHGLNHAPGTSHLYTNTGYALLAIIVERVSGQAFADYTRERLFEPAGMEHTSWQVDMQRPVPGLSVGYTQIEPARDGKPARFARPTTARHVVGNGGLLSTVGDMLRWNAALQRNAFGPRLTGELEQRARLRNGFEIDYARGLYVGRYRGLRELQHTGYTGAYSAWVARYPQADLSIALLCNGDGDDVYGREVADLFLPAGTPPEAKAPQGDPVDLSSYNGLYRDARTQRLALLQFPKDATLVDGRYVQGSMAYVFDDRHPQRLVRSRYGNSATLVRLPAWTAAPAQLKQYVGRYTSDELLSTYEVRLDGTRLAISVRGLSDLTAPLQPVARDVFVAQGIGLPVEFQRDRSGRIVRLSLSPDLLRPLAFDRVE
jgi:CubicO group peptidase (beta-lactamase class C family)